jgi:hypothetical protein
MNEALSEIVAELAEIETDVAILAKGDHAKARMALRAAMAQLGVANAEFKGEYNLTRDDLAFCALYSFLYQISKGQTVYGDYCQDLADQLLRAILAAEPDKGAPKMPRFLARKHDPSFAF